MLGVKAEDVLRNVIPALFQSPLCLQENRNDNKPAVLATDKTERLFVVHIGHTGLRLQSVVVLLMTVPPRLPPTVRSSLVCRVCISSVRSSNPCRERRPVRLRPR